MSSLQLLTLEQLSRILGRSPETVRKDITRNPGAVPPRVCIPGTRQLRWRVQDVEGWLSALSIGAKQRGGAA